MEVMLIIASWVEDKVYNTEVSVTWSREHGGNVDCCQLGKGLLQGGE